MFWFLEFHFLSVAYLIWGVLKHRIGAVLHWQPPDLHVLDTLHSLTVIDPFGAYFVRIVCEIVDIEHKNSTPVIVKCDIEIYLY